MISSTCISLCLNVFCAILMQGKQLLRFTVIFSEWGNSSLQSSPQNRKDLLYFFGYKTESFSFQNNPINLDSSSNTDLVELWDCLGRMKLLL